MLLKSSETCNILIANSYFNLVKNNKIKKWLKQKFLNYIYEFD